MGNYEIEERTLWQRTVTPRVLEAEPIHRWYIFPHSYSSHLVHALIEEWELDSEDYILDPFAGAGTTLLSSKEKGIPATGFDLSPLAVFTTQVKIANYSIPRVQKNWNLIKKNLDPSRWNCPQESYPDLIHKALPGKLLGAFDSINREIEEIANHKTDRDFFRLALISILPHFSRAVSTGGWLKWVKKRNGVRSLPSIFSARVELMIGDLRKIEKAGGALCNIVEADARNLPTKAGFYTAVITSPPYPNRHDYTRVFGVELMFGFLNWEETRQLRYQSFHSHPEAHPKRPDFKGYSPPELLFKTLDRIQQKSVDQRVVRMLEGYFLDMYLCLKEIRRACRQDAKVGIVVGNAQYNGESVIVDELTAEIGEQVGLKCERIIVSRYRGNSAQQMGEYGRKPSRESVVVFNTS